MQIGISIKTRRAQQQPICILRTAHIAKIFIAPDETAQWHGTRITCVASLAPDSGLAQIKPGLKKSGGPGLIAFAAQHQRLANIDPAFFVILIQRIDTLHAQTHLGLAALATRQIDGRTTIHKNLPHIKTVVDQQRLTVTHPTAASIRPSRPGRIVFFVIDRHTQLCGQIFEAAIDRIKRVPVFVLIYHQPLAVG